MDEHLLNYSLFLGDNALITGQRLSEWCGHGPILEQDIAITNIALDHLGQARLFLQYAAKLKGEGATEDSLAYFRNENEFRNLLLTELPNGDWGMTLVKQFLYDTYHYFELTGLLDSKDDQIQAIAKKAIKEVAYHAQWSAEWIIRLGDGTEESHRRVQDPLNQLWSYTGEFFKVDDSTQAMTEKGIAPDYASLHSQWEAKISEVLKLATLSKPEDSWMQSGGRMGSHTEHMGFILAEMQHIPRSYPDAKW
jgi:ring-1,2-phenylacetyl-CoA epoxidase subunit PaaC